MKTGFSGRFIQYVESLDFGDAVSNQVIELDAILSGMGIRTLICSKWHHERVREYRVGLEDAAPTERDVAVVHYSGFSEHVIPYVNRLRCTKILHYHNITPHEFFQESSDLYSFCLEGRKQLKEIIYSFQRYWGDSQYNLDELIALGVNPARCSVIPIVVNRQYGHSSSDASKDSGAWIFVGRIAPNKAQVKLVERFAEAQRAHPTAARRLYLVGAYREDDSYYKKLKERIRELGLEGSVTVTGKVSDEEVGQFLTKAAVYTSLSEHEGFGVPLIEAAHFGLPVVALQNSAVGETLGNGLGLAANTEELRENAVRATLDRDFRASLLSVQRRNVERFVPLQVSRHVKEAVAHVIPGERFFRTVSIVICTYNRSDYLERCLTYLECQTNPNFEVVVVNGPSTDDTDDVLSRFEARIKVAENPSRNLSVSRNIGIEMSSGDLIAFIDDDAIPFDDWVDTLLKEYNSRPLSTAGLGGPVYYAGSLEFQSENIGFNRYGEAFLNIDSSKLGADGWERTLLGTNTCFQGAALRAERGFDEQFDYFLDESELCFRLQKHGYIVAYCDDLFLRHEFAKSENRAGKHNFNWYTISKNTAYFIAAYSGLSGEALRTYLAGRMERERIAPLKIARDIGEISEGEFAKYVEDIESGWNRGLEDFEDFPRLRPLRTCSRSFLPFDIKTDFPRVGVELPRLHICIVTKEFAGFSKASGGVGTLYYHLASELLLMGHRVTVITPGDEGNVYRRGRFTVRYAAVKSVCVDAINTPGFSANVNWSLSAMHALAVAHLERSVDIVESALWDSEALAISLLPVGERPFVVTRLVTPFSVAARMNGWDLSTRDAALITESENRLIEASDSVVAISESIAETIEAEHSISRDDRWSTSHCGIAHWPFFDFRADYGAGGVRLIGSKPVPTDQRVVLFIGRLEGRKGVDVLLRAANEFLKASDDVCLVLAGRDIEGWQERADSILEGEVKERVHFVGEVDDATRERLLLNAFCVVFPSRYESFGLVPLESFVHGIPVIGARVGAIPEVIVDEECGLLFEDGDSSALAGCVAQLLREPGLRDRLAEGARRNIRRFSARNAAIRTVRMYAELPEVSRVAH